MTPREFVEQRRKQYLAQTLERFEKDVIPRLASAPHLTGRDREAVDDFKEWTRRRFGAFEADVKAVLDLDDNAQVNMLGIELRDSLRSR
jgi:hypothetical protein